MSHSNILFTLANENRAKVASLAERAVIAAESNAGEPAVDNPGVASRADLFAVIRRSGLFDTAYYRHANPHVIGTEDDLLEHYLDVGLSENRQPNPYFDARWYLICYEDVAQSGMQPLVHYIRHGDTENRWPSPLFNTAWYREAYGVPPSESALGHYLSRRFEGAVSPVPEFNVAFYLAQNPSVIAARADAFEHFVNCGALEGRSPAPDFDVRCYDERNLSDSVLENPFLHWLAQHHPPATHDNLLTDSAVPEYENIQTTELSQGAPEDRLPEEADAQTLANSLLVQPQESAPGDDDESLNPLNLDTFTNPSEGVALDRVTRSQSVITVEGWFLGKEAPRFLDSSGAELHPEIILFPRKDVDDAYGLTDHGATGFLAAFVDEDHGKRLPCKLFLTKSKRSVQVRVPPADDDFATLETIAEQNVSRLAFLFKTCGGSARWAKAIVPHLSAPPAYFKKAIAHIEQSAGIDHIGGLVVGWMIAIPPFEVFVISQEGTTRSLSLASRWHRPDVADAYTKDFGTFSSNAGILIAVHGPINVGDTVSLVASDGNSLYLLSQAQWVPAPSDPVSYARWAFDFPSTMQTFSRRVESHDSMIIESLIKKRNESLAAIPAQIHDFGGRVVGATSSIIVPLYGRFDFMEHQLLAFSDDHGALQNAELIYVVDDPSISDAVIGMASLMAELVDTPFRVVTCPVNRGYAGANNLGVRFSSAPNLLFLNSDVIPSSPGWLDVMLDTLTSDAEIGAVGARLLYCNGSLQHDRMDFEWDPSWHAYLNKHPGSGLNPTPPSLAPVPCDAVTAACMLMRRSTFDEIGGFDDGFLFGDFEDSDVCFKIVQLGLKIVSIQGINVVHLERQSFSGIGSGSFREKVARYNASRHQRRWGEHIRGLRNKLRPSAA